jgi:Domain of unknown function (DUF4760)
VSAEWVTAIATAGTFVVIAASAVAALIQLRHIRGSNQIAALTEFRETMESEQFQRAQNFVSFELPERLKDPAERLKATTLPFSGDYTAVATVANMFEALGGFVRDGVIDSDVACNVVSLIVVRNWNALVPVVTYVRRKIGSQALWENFEYLALVSKRFIEAHPDGRYPRGEPRLPEDTSLLD